jgi:signal transduction histidine kinase
MTLPLPLLMASSEPLVFWTAVWLVGASYWGISRAILQHAVLAFPEGRLGDRVERVFVAFAYVAVLGTQALVVATADKAYVTEVPENPFAVLSDEALYYQLSELRTVVGAVIAGVFILIVVRRWRRASTSMRRVIGLPSLAAGASAALFIATAVLFLVSLGRPWVWDVRNQVYELEAFLTATIPFAILVGLVRSRLDRADVADMLVRLEEGRPSDRLRQALADTLGDPALEILVETEGGLSDLGGHRGTLPKPTEPRMATPVAGTAPAVWLIHDRALLDNPELLRSAGAAVRLTLDNERLHAAIEMQLAEVTASRMRIMEASDAERRRIERDLHDGAQQRLVTVALRLELLRDRAAEASPELLDLLDDTSTELAAALAELRELARGIHPAVLTQSGLRPAIESMALRVPLQVRLDVPDARFPAPVEAAAYFVVAEGLTNAVRYSGASQASVHVAFADGALDLTVTDDGNGGADPTAGSGLRGLADRLSALGGTLDVQSPPGSGTRLHVVIPCVS